MKKMGSLIFWEMILIFSSILMFRSAWIFLDQIKWMNSPVGLWISLIVGSVSGVVALWAIHKPSREKE